MSISQEARKKIIESKSLSNKVSVKETNPPHVPQTKMPQDKNKKISPSESKRFTNKYSEKKIGGVGVISALKLFIELGFPLNISSKICGVSYSTAKLVKAGKVYGEVMPDVPDITLEELINEYLGE